jgi:transcriptional regulator with XRE-family HTH domain
MAARRFRSLAAYRDALDLSQAEAARLIGITQSKWSRIESGRTTPSLVLAQRLAARTGVPLERLAAVAAKGRQQRRRPTTPRRGDAAAAQ